MSLSQTQAPIRYLSDKELETFRRDFQDKEREVQRYIGVYLSGLVLVTGWIVGPQSRPLLAMALGNGGYNVYAFLIFVTLNIVFTNFLIYKSITIHEITQFMTYVAKPDSGFLYWDTWRRSPQSATRPVRPIYTLTLSVLPVCVSALMMFGVWKLLDTDPHFLIDQLAALGNPVSSQQIEAKQGDVSAASATQVSPEQLSKVFTTATKWFWMVLALHAIPLLFFYVNVVPTYRRWVRIHLIKGTETLFKDLAPEDENDIDANSRVVLQDKKTGSELGEITPKQLAFLIENLEEEKTGDIDYCLQPETLDVLKSRDADPVLIDLLRGAMASKRELEIRWIRIPRE